MKDMRTDFENLRDGDRVMLFPKPNNPLHKKPVAVVFAAGYYYAVGTNPAEGADYYFGDVHKYNKGFKKLGELVYAYCKQEAGL